MIQLRTLGVPSLTKDGVALSGAAMQPRRLALLAVIASSGPGGVKRQDLMKLFWSSHSVAATSHALSQWMFLVRRTLGVGDLFLGSTHVTLNPHRIEVDVTAFDAAVSRHDWATASAVYGGGFLSQFTLTGAPNFAEWLIRARSYRAQSVIQAVATIARHCQEHRPPAEALPWLQRLVSLEPGNTKFVVRLTTQLETVGDVEAALSVATSHANTLRHMLGAEPPDELVVAIERLSRKGGAAASMTRSAERSADDTFVEWMQERLSPRFVVERTHHHTSVATFFVARHVASDAAVRVKAYLPDLVQHTDRTKLLFLLRTAAGLRHPGIDSPEEVNSFGGTVCAILHGPFGITLRDHLEQTQRLSVAEACAIGADLASALEYVHRCGGTHGDVMPRRVAMRGHGATLTDVGVVPAIELSGSRGRFDAGLGMGAAAYMSPQRLIGEHDTQAADDIYSLGCVLHHMLFGEPPHYNPSPALIIRNRLSGGRQPRLPTTTTLPTPLQRMLRRMLSMSAEERPCAAEIRTTFESLRASRLIGDTELRTRSRAVKVRSKAIVTPPPPLIKLASND